VAPPRRLRQRTANVEVIIARIIPIERTTDFPNSGPLDMAALNTQLDKLVAICQQIDATTGSVSQDLLDQIALISSLINADTTVTLFATRNAIELANFDDATLYIRTAGYLEVGDGGHALYALSDATVDGSVTSADGKIWRQVETSATVASRAIAEDSAFPPGTITLVTNGYATAGDRGGSIYLRNEVSAAGAFQSADGAWWHVAEVCPNILALGADSSGISDSFVAVQDAIDILPASGGEILVPLGSYVLSAEPALGEKSIFWRIAPGTRFSGAGATYGKFRSFTQAGNIASGPWMIDRNLEPNVYSGQLEAYNTFAFESVIADPPTPRVNFTGNLSNGSATVSSVSSFSGLYLGAPVYDGTEGGSGLPYGYDNSQPRIIAMSPGAATITLSLPHAGSDVPGATLSTDFHQWKTGLIGVKMSSASRDTVGWGLNIVLEMLEGARGVGYGVEVDVATYGADGEGIGRAYLASGHGDYDPDTAYEASRSDSTRWLYGAKLRNTHNGLRIESDNTSIYLESNAVRGMVDDQMAPTEFGSDWAFSWLAFEQRANDKDIAVFRRKTDSAPTGTFLRMLTKANTDMLRFETNGNIFAGALPSTIPGASGYLWVDNGVVKRTA
jgi:hypothetical protein